MTAWRSFCVTVLICDLTNDATRLSIRDLPVVECVDEISLPTGARRLFEQLLNLSATWLSRSALDGVFWYSRRLGRPATRARLLPES